MNVLAGVSYEHYKYQKQKSYRLKFPTNGMTDMNGGSSAPDDTYAEGGSNEDKLMSYFGRVNYSFMDRYLLEANIRADASSRHSLQAGVLVRRDLCKISTGLIT